MSFITRLRQSVGQDLTPTDGEPAEVSAPDVTPSADPAAPASDLVTPAPGPVAAADPVADEPGPPAEEAGSVTEPESVAEAEPTVEATPKPEAATREAVTAAPEAAAAPEAVTAATEAVTVAAAVAASEADAPVVNRSRRRVVAGRVLTVLAGLLVFFALIAPNAFSRLTVAGGYLRLPIEGSVGVVVLLLLPVRSRQVAAGVLGALLGLLTVVKMVDMGFLIELGRPFDLVLDWVLFDDAFSFLTDSVGRAGAVGAAVGAVLLASVIPVLVTLCVLRVTKALARHRIPAFRLAAVMTVVWVALATFGVQINRGVPTAARSTSTYAFDRVVQLRAGMQDEGKFAKQSAADAFRSTPGDQLLAGLRGKDVIVAFVESYGRSALEDPGLGPQIGAALDTGTQRMADAGFTARSGFLTSPTFGGGSWLAHSTLMSGLWVSNQQRYRTLTASDRLTLPGAFKRANWRTIGVEPGVTRAWPEGEFYGYDKVYDSRTLGYQGPRFSWSRMPDQYAFAAFDRLEYRNPKRDPLMAEITLTSSHTPWAPIPRFIPWKDVGDGSVYHSIVKDGKRPKVVWKDPELLRTEYRRSVGYTINTLVSYVVNYGKDNLVMVFLGDHQPATNVTGEGASHDVPVTIVAHDPAVLDRISGWGWTPGLKPAPQAPVWPMNDFRDRFLTAFGHQGGAAAGGPTTGGSTVGGPTTGGSTVGGPTTGGSTVGQGAALTAGH